MSKTKREVEWERPGRREHQADLARVLHARPEVKLKIKVATEAYWTPERRAAQSIRAHAQGLGREVRA